MITKKQKTSFKKVLAFLLVVCMMLGTMVSLTSLTAFAAAPATYTTITANSTASVNIATSGDAKYFKFVPTQSGTYKFYSTDYTGDPYGALLDENGSTLISDDDDGNLNFSFTYECTANTTYYVKAYMHSSNTGSYTLNIATISIICEHNYILQSTTPASCQNNGISTYSCSLCGDSYNTTTAALGHDFSDGHCTRCGNIDYTNATNVNIDTPYNSYPLFNSGRTGSGTKYNSSYNYDETSFTNNGYDLYSSYSQSEIKDIRLGINFTMHSNATEKAQVTIYAYDVDEESGERDCIRLVDETTGTKTVLTNTSGKDYLSGQDSTWSTTTFEIPASLLVEGHRYHFENEETVSGWVVYIRTVDLQINGLETDVPVPPITNDITYADLSGYISSGGTVYTTLNASASTEKTFTLEYKATYLAEGAQKGSSTTTVTIPTEVTTFTNSFNLESGSSRGTYEVTVYIKLDGQVKATKTFSASYGYSAVSYNENGGSNNKPTDTNTYSSGDTVTVKFDYIPSMYGYNFLGWSTDRYATTPMYTVDGTNTFTIGSSDVTLYAVWALAVCEHNYELQSTVPATCCRAGSETYVCYLCGDTYTVATEMLEHHFVPGTIIQYPTCTEEGLKNPDRCDLPGCELAYAAVLHPIPALGHDYVDGTCSRCGAEQPPSDVWDGSIDTSWYNSTATEFTIYTAEQLAGLAKLVNDGNTFSGKTIYLGNNIDLAGREWTPIGIGNQTDNDNTSSNYVFKGIFNGRSYTISNLYIDSNSLMKVGLFGSIVNAEIKSVGVINATVKMTYNLAMSYGGILSGSAINSTITKCYVSGLLDVINTKTNGGHNATAGMLIGCVNGEIIVSDCYAIGTASAKSTIADSYKSYSGGIIGVISNGNAYIDRCYFAGNLSAESISEEAYVGGIVGISSNSNMVISDCFTVGTFNSEDYISGIATLLSGNTPTIYNCYQCVVENGPTSQYPGTSTNADNFKSQSWIESTLGWDFNTVWEFKAGSEYPVLKGFDDPVPPIVHTHEYNTVVVSPTCTSHGYTEYTCDCGESYRDNYVDPIDHTWDNGVVEFNATCTTDGRIVYSCACGATTYGVIPAFGHNIESIVVTEVTCTTDGLIIDYCINAGCDYEKRTVIHGSHSYSITNRVEPTCTVDGYIEYTCELCGDKNYETITASHNYVESARVEAQVDIEGSITYTCTKCGDSYSIAIPALVPVLKNSAVLLIQDTLPWANDVNRTLLETLKTRGVVSYYNIINTNALSSIDLSQYGVVFIANDQTTSMYNRLAANAEKLENYVRAGGNLIYGACDEGWGGCGSLTHALPGGVMSSNYYSVHNYIVNDIHPIVTGIYTDNRSLRDELLKGNYCSHTYFDASTLPADANIILRDAKGNPTLVEYSLGDGTVMASGLTWEYFYVRNHYNMDTNYSKYVYDDLLTYMVYMSNTCEHNYEFVETVPPTCEENGYTKYVCTLCAYEHIGDIVAPLGHTPGEWIIDTEPTATQTGRRHKDCTVCGNTVEVEVLPVLAKLVIDKIEAEAGSVVRVSINIQNNPGILGAILTLNYDPALTLLRAEAGGAWSTLNLTPPRTLTNSCNFVWDGLNNDYSNGSILILTFQLPDDADVGTVYDISASYTYGNIINEDMENVTLGIENGSIEVFKIMGDANDDGIVDVADVITLRRYLAGGYGITIDASAADMNGDGIITIVDVTLLRRLLLI